MSILSKETCLHFAKVGAPHQTVKPHYTTPITHALSLEECIDLLTEREETNTHQSLLSRLVLESHRLEERLSSPPPLPLPLAERISEPPTTIHIPPPIPDHIHFRKTKLLLRIKEIGPLLEATKVRLEPLFIRLNEEDDKEESGLAVRVPLEIRNKLWIWHRRLEDLYEDLDTLGHRLTNAEWRKLKGALKRIGKVSFKDLNNRLAEICTELLELEITLP
jgi:hypothetical protein